MRHAFEGGGDRPAIWDKYFGGAIVKVHIIFSETADWPQRPPGPRAGFFHPAP
jgi:hypothetical protein